MEPTVMWLALGGAAALVLIIVVARRRSAKRRDALQALAHQSGWVFDGRSVRLPRLALNAFPLFSTGHSHRASNVMRASAEGYDVLIFDHQYSIGHGKHRTTHSQTVVHLRAPQVELPPFVLSPERVLHKLGGLLGYHDIDFSDSPEFSSKYLLRSKVAEDRVRMLFTPALRLFFEQRSPLTVEALEHELLVYRARRRIPPEDLRMFFEEALAISRELQQASR